MRSYEERVKSYIDTIEVLNKKDTSAKQRLSGLTQDLEERQRDVSALRTALNTCKISTEHKEKALGEFEKSNLELKMELQRLRTKVETTEAKARDEKESRDRSEKERETLYKEKEILRTSVHMYEEEVGRLRAEITKWKEEGEAIKKRTGEQLEVSRGSDSGKREFLNEIGKKNSDINNLNGELKEQRMRGEEMKKVIDELEKAKYALNTRIAILENELGAERRKVSNLQMSTTPSLGPEHFSNTSPNPLSHIKSSVQGQTGSKSSSGYFSQPKDEAKSSTFIIEQKEEEISDLKKINEGLKKELSEKNTKLQNILQLLSGNEASGDEKSKLLQERDEELVEARRELKGMKMKYTELEERMLEMIHFQEDLESLTQKLADQTAYCNQLELTLKTQEESNSKQINEMQIVTNEDKQTIRSLETQVKSLQGDMDRKMEQTAQKEERLCEEIESMKRQLETKQSDLEMLEAELKKQKDSFKNMVEHINKVAEVEKELDHARETLRRTKDHSSRYSSVANGIYYFSIKCDTIYREGIAIFVKYAKSVYIPLVFSYQKEDQKFNELSRESSLESLEEYLVRIKRYQEQINTVSYVLDMASLDLRLRKTLETNSMIMVARVSEVVVEQVDMKSNKDLVSFVETGWIKKVVVSDVLSLMSGSFDNSIDFKLPILQTGSQNKTFSS